MILVVGHHGDDHISAVVERLLDDGREVVVLDSGALARDDSLELAYHDDEPPSIVLDTTAGGIPLTQASAGWWRRLRALEPDPAVTDPSAIGFVHTETAEVFDGAIASLHLDWVNPPAADTAAHHKPLQWKIAADVGLALPRTIVTRRPDRARAFVEELGAARVVTKAFVAQPEAWRETHRLGPDDVARLDQVRFAPTILQEYVAGVDLRVTMIDGEAYAAEIDATATSLPSDMRMVLDQAEVRRAVLPDDLVAALRALMGRLGLVYGAIDLRRTVDGEYRFFEVNPAGLWRFVEQLTGLPITDAVAGALARRDAPGRRERVVA
ncbi:MvdC/MvdD family ATP grasp protein [Agromyces sp. ZXT2-3]|uniref:MvdC/MvdD family ATP grasp protein n=1 Tax=Agromyces sp. ZXT2-3 TaxID=3461152 RepID=UPI004054E134